MERLPQRISTPQQAPTETPALIDRLLKAVRKKVLLITTLMALNGCVSMHQPDYAQEYRRSDEGLTLRERDSRSHELKGLLSAPDQEEKTSAWQSGLDECQIRRILDNSEFLLEEATEEAFEDFIGTCRAARDTLGIMNVDRYSAKMISEALQNYQNPDLRRERPVVLAIMSREDHEGLFGLQALNVESHRIEELSHFYKVILVETASMGEILHHVAELEKRGILREGNLHGVLVGSHGDQDSTEAGIDLKGAQLLARMNRFFPDNGGHFVYASCEAGADGDDEENLAGITAQVLPRAQVVACDGLMVGIAFQTDSQGRFDPDSLRLESLSDFLSFGLFNNTYLPHVSQVRMATLQRYLKTLGDKVSPNFISTCVLEGISCGDCITALYERQRDGRPHVSPQEFRRLMECFDNNVRLWRAVDLGLPVNLIESYRNFGFRLPDDMQQLHRAGILPSDIAAYRSSIYANPLLDSKLADNDRLIVLARLNLHPRQVKDYYRANLIEAHFIKQLNDRGISADEYLNSLALGFNPLFNPTPFPQARRRNPTR